MEAKGLALFLDSLHLGCYEIGFRPLVLKKKDDIRNMVLIGADNYATSIIHHFQDNISPSFHEDTVFQSTLPVLQECEQDYNTLEDHNMRETRTPKTVSVTNPV